MHVGGAAAEVRLQAVDIRVVAVVVPVSFVDAHADLVDLLHVLMRHHVGCQRAGQRVEGHLFQHVAQLGLARAHAQQRLGRVHQLVDRAALGALGGAVAVDVLVAGEHAVGHAVELHQLLIAHVEAVHFLRAGAEGADDAGRLEAHGHVDHVGEVVLGGVVGPVLADERALALALKTRLHLVPGDQLAQRAHEREDAEVRGPVQRLPLQLFKQLEQEFLAGQVVQPDDRLHVLRAAGHRPVVEGLFVQRRVLILEIAEHELGHAAVAGRGEVLHEHLQHDHARPPVLVALRAEEAVLALTGERPLDILHADALELFVLQLPGQRHQAVQIIGGALPGVAIPAAPGAVLHVVPKRVQLAGQAVSGRHQLLQQPAARTNRAQRQRSHCVRGERRTVKNRAVDHVIRSLHR